MWKDFTSWFIEKCKIHNRQDSSKYHIWPREIWSASIWINIWNESDGKTGFQRPVLIISKVWSVFWVLPMTTKWKDNNIFYHKIASVASYISSYVLLSQIRTIDKRRLQYRMATISEAEFTIIKKSLLQWIV